MLLRFTVANYASIRDELELTAIAQDDHHDIAVMPVPRSDESALPVVGIFGPNATGKSNIIMALGLMRSIVMNSHQKWLPGQPIPHKPFLLDEEMRFAPTEFCVDMVIDDVRYSYGFEYNSHEFLKEWLYAYPEGRPRKLFDRTSGVPIDFGPTLKGARTQVEKMLRPNSLYLSAAAANNHGQLSAVYNWFSKSIRIATDQNFDGRLDETRHFLEFHNSQAVLNLLKYADLGVTDAIFRDVNLPAEVTSRLMEALSSVSVQGGAKPSKELFSRVEVELSHTVEGRDFKIPLEFESNGTRTWLGIVGPIVSTLRSGSILAIDELDARLHHHLAAQLIRLFQDPRTNPNGAQLVFNSHDAALLGPDAVARLRRDQVWFTEKVNGATSLFPLTDYKVRSIENIEKRYLGGRYGSLPCFDESLLTDIIAEITA
jgi:hypothetical protein